MNIIRAIGMQLIVMLNLALHTAQAQSNATIEIPPEYIGGQQQLNADIRRYLVYPENAKTRNISGKVIVEFDIDLNGKVQNTKVIEGIIPSMDSAAINLINFLDNWKPGLINGVPVTVKMKLPIQFNTYGNSNSQNENQILIDIQKYKSKIAVYLTKDSIAEIKKIINSIPANLYPDYYQVLSFNEHIMLFLITKEYLLAADRIKVYVNNYNQTIYTDNSELSQSLDIYLKAKHSLVSYNLKQADIDFNTKNILTLFLTNDSLRRFPSAKNIRYSNGWNYDKTYVAKRSKLGYKYLKTTTDTTYNHFIKNVIVAEKRYKNFAMGFGMGYTKIIHNSHNRKIFSDPNLMYLTWDFLYKNVLSFISLNIGGSKNYLPVTIDTFNLKENTKLGNNYTQIGIGYRFYPNDLLHIIPYVAYNYFDVSYLYEINKDKSITKSEDLEALTCAGFIANCYFSKNNWANYKPANYFPLGLSFKYGLIAKKIDFSSQNLSHYFSLSFTLIFTGPVNN